MAPLLRGLPLIAVLLVAASCAAGLADDFNEEFRRVVLVEKHGFRKGRSVGINMVEAPGQQKLLAIVCRDPTMSLCQGFRLDGKAIYPMLREPQSYKPDDVFEAFFGGPYKSKLFGPDATGRVLRNTFTLTHLEDGTLQFTYEYKDEGQQRSTIRPKPRNQGFDYLFVGAEVRVGVADPVGYITNL